MLTLSVNGESRSLPGTLTVAQLLEQLGYDRQRVAVEINGAVAPRALLAERTLADGDRLEIVTLVGGGAPDEPPADKPIVIGKFRFRSRLITGTGKYAD